MSSRASFGRPAASAPEARVTEFMQLSRWSCRYGTIRSVGERVSVGASAARPSRQRQGAALTRRSSLGQYTSGDFRALLDKHKGLQSLSRPRQCWDNPVAESFFSTLKEELVYRSTFPTRAAARAAIFEFIEVFDNRGRLHSTLGNLTPAEYEEQRLKQPEAA